MIHKRGKGKVYYYDIHHKNRRYRGTTGHTSRKKAQDFHDDFYEKVRRQWKGLAETGNQEIKCRELFEMFLEAKEFEVAEGTWKSYKYFIESDLNKHFGDYPVIALTKSMVNKFISGKRREGIKGSTINTRLGRFKAILNWAVAQELIAINPIRFERVREAEKKEPIITDAELEKIYSVKKPFPAFNDMVFIARHTGLRISNVVTMEWAQLDLSSREKAVITIQAERMKGGKTISLPLNEEVVDRLIKISKVRMLRSDYVFPKPDGTNYRRKHVSEVFMSTCKGIGLKYCFHDLRHTFASYKVIEGVDLYIVAKLLGHRNINMVQRYAHLNVEHLRKAVTNSPQVQTSYHIKQ